MNDIKEVKRIFVLCPENFATGGTELLHQLVFTLNGHGKMAFIVYINKDGNISENCKVTKGFETYNVEIAYYIEDDHSNLIILYEGIFNKAFQFEYCVKMFWWLSVDNFYVNSMKFISLIDYYKWNKSMAFRALCVRIYNLIVKRKNYFTNNYSIRELVDLDVLNCYQSEYAQYHLINLGFKRTLPLTDFINLSFLKEKVRFTKENAVLYNPKKGLKFTQKLIQYAPHLHWIPLENKNRDELSHLFKTSKIYIDFGHFPGKDRMPREAVINDCCIITGIKGAARFYEDVSIPSKYKIEQINKNIPNIISLIESIFLNYEESIKDFEIYRQMILSERGLFEQQVKTIFERYDF